MIRNIRYNSKNSYRNLTRNSWNASSNLLASFHYAFQGIVYGLMTQRNLRIHLFLGTFAFILGLFLDLKSSDFALLALTITMVLVLELLNTSIEAVVNLSIGRRFHPLAKVAKDCAAASVLIASISSLLIGCLLLLPPLFS
tara:strand:- start:117 stop:539 length:423 start_codon:yes stop_codon:yes gene_type:complete